MLRACGGYISNNTATGNGGGIYSSGSVELNKGSSALEIGDNEANYGGGIYVNSGAVYMGDTNNNTVRIIRNKAVLGGGVYNGYRFEIRSSSATIEHNTATSSGGGIYSNSRTNIGLNCGKISENTAVKGAGVYLGPNDTYVNGGPVEICKNTSSGTGASGGGIYVDTGSSSLTIALPNAQIYQNTTTGNGGGIYTNRNSLFFPGTTTIKNNHADGNGGGFYCAPSSGSTTISNNVYVQENTCDGMGAGIYTKHTLVLANSYVRYNTSSGTYGGGICAETAVQITGSHILNNTCNSGNGGGVCMLPGKSLNITGSEIIYNVCSGQGAGIYIGYDGSTTGCVTSIGANSGTVDISYNQARGPGGGIYCLSPGLTILNSTINYNSAESIGGGIYVDKDLSISNSTIKYNSGMIGSAIYAVGSSNEEISLNSVQIENNRASYNNNSGAIKVQSNIIKLSGNTKIINNTNKNYTGQHNLVLEQDSNTIIQTTEAGLSSTAEIGVFVTGDESTNPFVFHGGENDPFGTLDTTAGGDGDKNLNTFKSDRVRHLIGTKGEGENAGLVVWKLNYAMLTVTNTEVDEETAETLSYEMTIAGAVAGDTVDVYNSSGTVIDTLTVNADGKVQFSLTDGESIILYVPAETNITVTESIERYRLVNLSPAWTLNSTTLTPTNTATTSAVTINMTSDSSLNVTNTFERYASPTGVDIPVVPYAIMSIFCLALIVMSVYGLKKKRN